MDYTKFIRMFALASFLLCCSFVGNVYATESVSMEQQGGRTVKGVVLDENGIPLPGVNVYVKGNQVVGTATGADGEFSFSIDQNAKVLIASTIGYATQEITIGNQRELTINLKPDTEILDEVVVTAFGTGQKKASVVGAIQTVRPAELTVSSANLSAGFAGKLAGVIAVQRSGEPGADGANFWIRGISSVNATNPLIVLDGVEISSGDLNSLDPEIIDGFSILKDATATALYGSRGANGVVIVTTKTGRDLAKPIINFRVEGYMTQPTKIPQFVDAPEYMELFNEAIGNLSTGDAPYPQKKIDGTRQKLNPYIYPNVNWYDELFKDIAFNQKANFNIRGGGKKLDYFMSVTFDHQTGMLKDRSTEFTSFDNSIDVKRYAFQNNIRTRFSETSTLSLRLNAQIGSKRMPTKGINNIFGSTMNANPADFPIFYPKDEFTPYTKWGSYGGTATADLNPFAQAITGYADNFYSTVIANLEFKQDLKMLTPGLKFSALASFKNWSSTTTKRDQARNNFEMIGFNKLADGTYDITTRRLGDEQSTTLSSSGDNRGDRNMYFQMMFLWDRSFGAHELSAMANYNQNEYSTNMADRNILNNLPKRRQSLAGRLSYGYDNRYMVEANFGYNGSENFAKSKRFGFFPSVALGYNVSQEKFWEPIKPYVSQLKLRASYGLVGNDQIGGDRFAYLANVKLQDGGRSYTTGLNQTYTLNGVKFERFSNPEITWEVGEKLNIGVDITFFNDLRLNVDLFKEKRTDIFIQRGAIPTYMGTADSKLWGNLAEIENKGIDAALDYNKRINDDLTVSFRGTFTFARNKVLKWDEPPFAEYPQRLRVGHRLNMYQGYIAERLFIDQADVDNSPEQLISSPVQAGDIKYKDLPNANGEKDGKITENDQQYIGNPTVPEIVYGFGPSIQYKDFDFSFFFQGVANTSLMMEGFHPFGTQYNRNVLQFIADDRWSPTNQNIHAAYPRLTKLDHRNNTVRSTYWLRDGSFLKLKSAEVGYTWRNMRVYLRGQNLLTFSEFDLWDPEMGGGSGLKYPTQRTISFGFQMTIK